MAEDNAEQAATLAKGVRANMSRKELIFATCDDLLRDGNQVTEAKILSIVGGSSSTVHRYVKEWKELSALRVQAPAVPATFLESLNNMFIQLVEDARQQSKAREEELAEEITALEDDNRELKEALARQGTKEAELSESNRELSARIRFIESELAEAKAEGLGNETAKRTLEAQVQDLKGNVNQIREGFEAQLADLKEQHQAELQRLESVYQRSEDRLFGQIAEQDQQFKDRLRSLQQEYENKLELELSDSKKAVEQARSERDDAIEKCDIRVAQLSEEIREAKEALTETKEVHAQRTEGYEMVASAFAELFEVSVEESILDKAELQALLRSVKKRFYEKRQR